MVRKILTPIVPMAPREFHSPRRRSSRRKDQHQPLVGKIEQHEEPLRNGCARFAALSPRKPTPGFLGAAAREPAAQGRDSLALLTARLKEVAEKSSISALHLYSRGCSPLKSCSMVRIFQSGVFLKTLLPWYYTAGISLIIRTKL